MYVLVNQFESISKDSSISSSPLPLPGDHFVIISIDGRLFFLRYFHSFLVFVLLFVTAMIQQQRRWKIMKQKQTHTHQCLLVILISWINNQKSVSYQTNNHHSQNPPLHWEPGFDLDTFGWAEFGRIQ